MPANASLLPSNDSTTNPDMVSEDALSPEQATRIADAVETIEMNVSQLRTYQKLSREAYQADANREAREAIERKFEKLTAAVVDIARTILDVEGVAVPDERKPLSLHWKARTLSIRTLHSDCAMQSAFATYSHTRTVPSSTTTSSTTPCRTASTDTSSSWRRLPIISTLTTRTNAFAPTASRWAP